MFESMMTQPCTVVSLVQSGVDAGNNPTYTEATVATTCFVDWSRSRLRAGDANRAQLVDTTEVPIVLPPETVIGQKARLIIGGDTWGVVGNPASQWNPLGSVGAAFVEVLCEQVTVPA